jgi:hypothetical protein
MGTVEFRLWISSFWEASPVSQDNCLSEVSAYQLSLIGPCMNKEHHEPNKLGVKLKRVIMLLRPV